MITKISAADLTYKSKVNVSNPSKVQYQATSNSMSLTGSSSVDAYQALNGIKLAKTISFGAENLTRLEQSIIVMTPPDKNGKTSGVEIRIPDLFGTKENIDLTYSKMPEKTEHLNAKGLHVANSLDRRGRVVRTITNDKGDVIFVGKMDKSKAKSISVVYKQGKFMPEITVKDSSSLGKKSIKMLAGSQLTGSGFDFRMPGKYEPIPGGEVKSVSFQGRTIITTLNKEDRTVAAVENYKNSTLPTETVRGDYYDLVKEDDPTIVIAAGGFGERFRNLARDVENKPSYKLPTKDAYRIIATPLNLAASAGIINADETDDIKYLSEAHTLSKGENVYHVQGYRTDGAAIAQGLTRDIIKNDKPVVILNADIFTNADITRTYHSLKTLPNAALIIPYYPVNSERAKSFGLLGVEKDDAGNLEIKEFIEKPKYTAEPPNPNDFSLPGDYDKAMAEFNKAQMTRNPKAQNEFFANPGFYFLNPHALKVLAAKGLLAPNETGLGKHVMPKIVELAKTGQLLDENGNRMKVYTVPLEAKGGNPAVWDDIGTAEAYLKLIKDVAKEARKGNNPSNKYYGIPEFVMNDFKANADLRTGIVFDSAEAKAALSNFKQKHNVKVAKGNIYVASK